MREELLTEFDRGSRFINAFPPDQTLLTSREVAAALKVSTRALSYWTASGHGRGPRLSFVKIGKAKRFIVRDVVRFIEAQKIRAA